MNQEDFLLYDEIEQTSTRYVGYAGLHARFDLAIVTTSHFYGKKLVCSIHDGKFAILGEQDLTNIRYLQDVFSFHTEEETIEFAEFLSQNL